MIFPLTGSLMRQLTSSSAVVQIVGNTVSLSIKPKGSKLKATVSGTIFDEEGDPLPGATVSIQGTTNGVASDIDGNFTLHIDNENPILLVNCIGMHTYHLALTDKSVKSHLKIVMSSSISQMDEVVVTGYQNIKKENATGAFQQISSKISTPVQCRT